MNEYLTPEQIRNVNVERWVKEERARVKRLKEVGVYLVGNHIGCGGKCEEGRYCDKCGKYLYADEVR